MIKDLKYKVQSYMLPYSNTNMFWVILYQKKKKIPLKIKLIIE